MQHSLHSTALFHSKNVAASYQSIWKIFFSEQNDKHYAKCKYWKLDVNIQSGTKHTKNKKQYTKVYYELAPPPNSKKESHCLFVNAVAVNIVIVVHKGCLVQRWSPKSPPCMVDALPHCKRECTNKAEIQKAGRRDMVKNAEHTNKSVSTCSHIIQI